MLVARPIKYFVRTCLTLFYNLGFLGTFRLIVRLLDATGTRCHGITSRTDRCHREHNVGQALSSAFETELVATVPRLRRFAYSLTGSVEDGDDLVQAACERALRNASKFREGTRMDSWMFRIVQNLWHDDRRRARTRGHQIDAEQVGLSDGGLSARHAEDRMTLAKLREAVAQLPPEQRAVIALVAIDGMSYREAADVMDVPLGTVMSRLSRARSQLSAIIGRSVN